MSRSHPTLFVVLALTAIGLASCAPTAIQTAPRAAANRSAEPSLDDFDTSDDRSSQRRQVPVPHTIPPAVPHTVPQTVPHTVPQTVPHTVPQPAPHVDPQPAAAASQKVFVTKTGDKYHRTECHFLYDHNKRKNNLVALTIQDAKKGGYTPCSERTCFPSSSR